jgi:soluble lytic murein transglycosylase-like protein
MIYILLFLGLTAPASVRAGPPAAPRSVAHQIAVTDPSLLCETAVTTAEYVGRLPSRLLGAISLTEAGRMESASRRVRPWPWTINAEGAGQYFETKQQAIDAVKALQARGVQSIDVGCLQVNLMYHPHAFRSLDDAFDPLLNATYATRFLNKLYAASKDWATAIAAYHSETPVLGGAYRVLVMARWQNSNLHPAAGLPPPAPYGDFAQADKAYGAFAPRSSVYGAFAPR